MVTVPAVLFVYASTRPIVRLRADMPPRFADVSKTAGVAQRKVEQRLAETYWNCALTFIQWKYSYGSPLPDHPPDEFRIRVAMPAVPGPSNAKAPQEPDAGLNGGGLAGSDPDGVEAAGAAARLRRKRPPPDPVEDSRLRYWRRLQELWVSPEAWQRSREWNTEWMTGPVTEAVEWSEDYVRNWTGTR